MNYNELLGKLLAHTEDGSLNWDDISSSCFETVYEGTYFIICKYFSDAHAEEIGTYRVLDEFGMADEDSKVTWTANSPEWTAFVRLFSKLEMTYVF